MLESLNYFTKILKKHLKIFTFYCTRGLLLAEISLYFLQNFRVLGVPFPCASMYIPW